MNKVIYEDMKQIYGRFADLNWLKNQSVFITGAYGMLASYLTFFLIFLNEQVPEMNLQIYAQGRSIEKMSNRFGEYLDKAYFHVVTDDICQPLFTLDKIDYIIHAASLASPQYYGINPVGTLLPNTIGTYYLLELARQKKVKGFLFFSSSEIYGVYPDGLQEVSEANYGYVDPINIRNCYSESKRMGESMCKAWSDQFGVPAKSVRIYHTYGPTMDIEHDQRSFSEFVRNVVDGKDIEMKSDGKTVRAFCYAADAVDAFLRVLRDGLPGESYNLCNSQGELSIAELAELLVNLRPEKKLKVIRAARSENDSYLESPVRKTPFVNTRKLRELGWNPTYSVAQGFRNTVYSFECNTN